MSSMFTKSRMKRRSAWKLPSVTSAGSKSRVHGRKTMAGMFAKTRIASETQRNTRPSKPRCTQPQTQRINRIGAHWKRKPVIIIYRDGRQRCNPGTPGGQSEYGYRKLHLFIRQDGLCCICRKSMTFEECTFEHENGRHASRIDERLEVKGKPLNGVSCLPCNSKRGSRRTKIYHYPQLERTT